MKLPADKLPEIIHATVKKVFEEKPDKYGKLTKGAYITVEDQDYNVYFKEKYFPIAVTGNKIMGVKKFFKGNPFFEWYSGGDGQTPNPNLPKPQEQPPIPPMPTQEVYEEKKPIDTQERIIKGMVYNNVSRRASTDCTSEAILDLCKVEYNVMKLWLTN